MTIPVKQIYPRTGDKETIYLKHVITNPNIMVGDFTMYNDFVNDPKHIFMFTGKCPIRNPLKLLLR